MFGAVTLAITVASLLFTAGYNWRRISEVAEAHEAFAKTVVNEYQRKDVQQEQNITMTSQLNAIREQIATLQRASERRPREQQ